MITIEAAPFIEALEKLVFSKNTFIAMNNTEIDSKPPAISVILIPDKFFIADVKILIASAIKTKAAAALIVPLGLNSLIVFTKALKPLFNIAKTKAISPTAAAVAKISNCVNVFMELTNIATAAAIATNEAVLIIIVKACNAAPNSVKNDFNPSLRLSRTPPPLFPPLRFLIKLVIASDMALIFLAIATAPPPASIAPISTKVILLDIHSNNPDKTSFIPPAIPEITEAIASKPPVITVNISDKTCRPLDKLSTTELNTPLALVPSFMAVNTSPILANKPNTLLTNEPTPSEPRKLPMILKTLAIAVFKILKTENKPFAIRLILFKASSVGSKRFISSLKPFDKLNNCSDVVLGIISSKASLIFCTILTKLSKAFDSPSIIACRPPKSDQP